jgi:hypothetical protein
MSENKNLPKNFKFDGVTLLKGAEAYLGECFHHEDNVSYYSHGLGMLAIHWHFVQK